MEPKPKPNGLSSAGDAVELGCSGAGMQWSRDAGEGQTDKLQRGSDTLHPPPTASCPSCPHALRPAELDTWGLCRTVLTALRAPRASPERNPDGGTFKNSKIQVFSLLSCGSAALRVAPWSVLEAVKGTAASCRQHSGGAAQESSPRPWHASLGGLLFYCCKFHAVLICQQCCLVGK